MKYKINTLLLFFTFIFNSVHAKDLMEPTSYSKDLYQEEILDGNYSNNITHPDEYLGFGIGERVAAPWQITSALKQWSSQSDRIKIIEYAKSHEGRPLHAVFISSPDNINNLDKIKSDLSALSDARNINDRQARSIIENLPAVAWMAYSIHGNETSGADGALAAIYHLIASTDDDVLNMLDDMVIIVDPLMNPDGRARFAKSLEQYRGTAPNYDDQTVGLHFLL